MTRRALVVFTSLLLVTTTVTAVWGQQSARSGTLADRISALRKGWLGGGEANETTDEAAPRRVAARTVEPRAGSAIGPTSPRQEATRYPQVNSRDLLPRSFGSAPRPLTSPERPSSSGPLPEEPRTASRPGVATQFGSSSRQTGAPRSLADAYLASPTIDANVSGTMTTPPPRAAPRPATSDRTAESIRRSPSTERTYDFDVNELRRDLVDSSGRSLSELHESTRQDTETTASETSKPETASTPAGIAPEMARSTAPLRLETSADDSDARGLDAPETLPDSADDKVATSEATSADAARAFADDEPVESTTPLKISATPVPEAGIDGQALSLPPRPSASAPAAGSASGRQKFAEGLASLQTAVDTLATNKAPLITSHVSGPQHILVGREATFRLRLGNQSDIAANEVIAEVVVPSGVELVDSSVSGGIVQRSQDERKPNTLRWHMHRLDGQSIEHLDVKVIPRQSRPLELGVTWTYAPVGSRAVVEVREPKLRMHVSGPDEVLFGKAQIYRLTLTNPGTGTAEDVKIELLPPGGGKQTVSSHEVGDLEPGTSKSVEVELTAREQGRLFVKASATAMGNLSTEAAKEIFCRKPELEVDWRGPETKYAGTVATYYFRARNPGTAAAEDVALHVRLPEGAEFLSASEGQSFDTDGRGIIWRIGTLRPGDDYYTELKVKMIKPGAAELPVVATTADGKLKDDQIATTNVVALADLKLNVMDPKGPIPVGEDALYEIRVRNRGTNSAEDVNIVALFSEGIEPHAVEGGEFTIADGRVAFRTIDKLRAGREIVLRIRARATTPGAHVFRAEVLCRELDIKLAAEETTRFFEDESFAAGGDDDAASRVEQFDTRR